LVFVESFILAIAGLAIGVPTAVAIMLVARGLFFGMPLNLTHVIVSAIAIVVASGIASAGPALRAGRQTPADVLRS
jgi:ABC-type antimicrobial peptide transport system permease subunit